MTPAKNGKDRLVCGRVLTMGEKPRILDPGAVHVVGSEIEAVGPAAALRKAHPEAAVDDFGERLVMPGLVNAHTHLYSALARGMPFHKEAPQNFVEILERVWWNLDKRLDVEAVRMSAMAGILDSLRHGTTTLLDHHASPFACAGSLGVMAEVVEEVGLRACLAYEVSDRDGPAVAREGIAENRSFLERCRKERRETLAASFGLHASFTLSDSTLDRCVEAAGGSGFHVHVAEDRADLEDARAKYGRSVVSRLHARGILGERTLAVHCIHLEPGDLDLLASSRTKVVHNPQSNCNNAVGTADVLGAIARGIPVGLGSDGFSANPFDELRSANVLHKLVRKDPRVGTVEVCDMLFRTNPAIAGMFFPKKVGALEAGAFADLIVLDYRPPTPMHEDNVLGHLLFGFAGSPVDAVMVGGRFLLKDGEVQTLDEERALARCREAARSLWEKL
jgi:putative selenium metabolism protein SsnA